MKQLVARALTFLCIASYSSMAQVPPPQFGTSYGSIVVPTFLPPTIHGDPIAYWANSLGLDAGQQASLKTIFTDQQTSTNALKTNLDRARVALAAGAKANSTESEIDRLATDLGSIFAQAVAVQAKAYARLCALLTQDQKQKFDALTALPAGASLSSVAIEGGPGATAKQ
jgi:Spy/CpxP family protein refolding chaperone